MTRKPRAARKTQPKAKPKDGGPMVSVGARLDSGIRILAEPVIYLVGKQTVDDAQLAQFLADHGVSWESDSEVAAEVLTETAGRLCYQSYAKPRPGGN